MLCELRDKHNNVLVVEHSRQMLSLADHIIEMGPGAGTGGGSVVFEGSLDELEKADTITAVVFRKTARINTNPLPWSKCFEIKDIRRGPGTNYNTTGAFTGVGVFTIVDAKDGKGSTKGWGKLKSGAGWISLDYGTEI